MLHVWQQCLSFFQEVKGVMQEARQNGFTSTPPQEMIDNSKVFQVTTRPPDPVTLLLTDPQEKILNSIIPCLEKLGPGGTLVLPEEARRIPADIRVMANVRELEAKNRVIYVEGIPSAAVIL